MMLKVLNLVFLCALQVSGASNAGRTSSKNSQREVEDEFLNYFETLVSNAQDRIDQTILESTETKSVWQEYQVRYNDIVNEMLLTLRPGFFDKDVADRVSNKGWRLSQRLIQQSLVQGKYKFFTSLLQDIVYAFFRGTNGHHYYKANASRVRVFEQEIQDDVLKIMFLTSKYQISKTNVPENIAKLRQLVDKTLQAIRTDEFVVTILDCFVKSQILEKNIMIELEDFLNAQAIPEIEKAASLNSVGFHGTRILRTMIIASDSKSSYKLALKL